MRPRRSGSIHSGGCQSVRPAEGAGGEGQPGGGIRLDHVGGRAAGVVCALNALHRTVRGNPNLYGSAGGGRSQHLQQVAHRCRHHHVVVRTGERLPDCSLTNKGNNFCFSHSSTLTTSVPNVQEVSV